jgi:hypothetical protein
VRSRGVTMNTELQRVLERARQARAARTPAHRATARGDTVLAHTAGGPLLAGNRAFDLVTGELVEVVSVHRENVVIAAPER